MVTDSWAACRELEPSTAEDPPCSGARHVKSVKSSNAFLLVWCGSWERGYYIRSYLRHLTMTQSMRSVIKSSRVAE
ncbi:hypothetical protein TNCV_4836331 [Trichonephila clavipes]|nr:hypothetical protein TNCV_4836331 [Trichonephila clavipes]